MPSQGDKRRPREEYERLSAEHEQLLALANRWGSTMRELGDGLIERPHRVFVIRPEDATDVVVPTFDLPTLQQIHQLADKIRRTQIRLSDLKASLGE